MIIYSVIIYCKGKIIDGEIKASSFNDAVSKVRLKPGQRIISLIETQLREDYKEFPV